VRIDASWQPLYAAPVVLVRPDQHVAWRGDAPATAAEAMAILRRALGWDATGAANERRSAAVTA
jgi:hypothetical protein